MALPSSFGSLLKKQNGPSDPSTEQSAALMKNASQSQILDQKANKFAGKLLGNLDALQVFSQQMNQRLQQQNQDTNESQKKLNQKQQEQSKDLESKLSLLQSMKKSLQNDLDFKKQSLQDQTDKLAKKKQELSQIQDSKAKALQEFQDATKKQLDQKSKDVQSLEDKIASLKDDLKQERGKRRQIEDSGHETDKIRIQNSSKINALQDKLADKQKLLDSKKKELDELNRESEELKKLLDDLLKQNEKEGQETDDLKKKLDDLNQKRDDLSKQIDLAPRNIDELEQKLERLSNDIKKLEDEIRKFNGQMNQLQRDIDDEGKKNTELNSALKVLQQQGAFEKQARLISGQIGDIEEKQRQLEGKYKFQIKCWKKFYNLSGEQSVKLILELFQDTLSSGQIEGLTDIQKQIQTKSEIKDDLKLSTAKISGRPYTELKAEQIQSYIDKLSSFQQQVDALIAVFPKEEKRCLQEQEKVVQYIKATQQKITVSSQKVLHENKGLVHEIDQLVKLNGEQKLASIEKDLELKKPSSEGQMNVLERLYNQIYQFKQVIKSIKSVLVLEGKKLDQNEQAQDFNSTEESQDAPITTFTTLNDLLIEQQQRLKKTLQDNLKALEDLYTSIKRGYEDLEDEMKRDEVGRCREKMVRALSDLSKIETVINQLQEKSDSLKDQLQQLDQRDDQSIRAEIEKDIEHADKQLESAKKEKAGLQRQLDRLKEMNDQDLTANASQIDEALDSVRVLKEDNLPAIDKELYDIECKFKKALKKKRSDKKKQCQESIQKNKFNLAKLKQIIEKIDRDTKMLEKEIGSMSKPYNYQDMEREKEIKDKLKKGIVLEEDEFLQTKEHKEALQKSILELDKFIEMQKMLNAESEPVEVNKDEQVQKLERYLARSQEIDQELITEIEKASKQQERLDALSNQCQQTVDKYRLKDTKFKAAKENQQLKTDQIDEIGSDFLRINRYLMKTQDCLIQMVSPSDDEVFVTKLHDKHKEFATQKDLLQKYQQQHDDLKTKLAEICVDLGRMGEQVVVTKDIQNIIDELDRLSLDFKYEIEQVLQLQTDADNLMKEVIEMVDQNRAAKIEEADRNLEEIRVNLQNVEQLYKEDDKKLAAYKTQIQEALSEYRDPEIQKHLRSLRKETDDLERTLRGYERVKSTLKSSEKIYSDKMIIVKSDTKGTQYSIKEIDEIAQNVISVNNQGEQLCGQLQELKEELDRRSLDLDNYLQRQSELDKLYQEFEQLLKDVKKNLSTQTRSIYDSNQLEQQLRNVLEAMESGTHSDYKLKEMFIRTELDTLDDLKKSIVKVEEVKDYITQNLDTFMAENKFSKDTIDADTLLNYISQASDMMEKLESADAKSIQIAKSLSVIKKDIGFADIIELIQLREREVQEFNGKLRKLEFDFNELKKLASGNYSQSNSSSPTKETLNNDVAQIERHIKTFKEDKIYFVRVLGQDLQIFLPQPSKLESLPLLRDTVVKVIELGLKTNKSLELIDRVSIMNEKLRRQIGGLDLMKRIKIVESKEQDQRERLIKIRQRFEALDKGASDCDGYTSNTEEATFIDTLLVEIPQMHQKQKEAIDECDNIIQGTTDIRKDIEIMNQNEPDEKQQRYCIESVEVVEDDTELNEKTVIFLEKLADKLEDHFYQMDVKKKLDKRQMELLELKNICEDFDEKLVDMQTHLIDDVEKIEGKVRDNPTPQILLDENGNQVDLLQELMQVHDELKEILSGVSELQEKNQEISERRNEVQFEFDEQIVKNSPYRSIQQGKISNKGDIFTLLKANGVMKKKIIEMIKQLKDVSRRIRDAKVRYQEVRNSLEKSQKPRKLYKAVKGDLVDELFADYINKLNCPVPIQRLGNNQYTFGTKKIYAKIINGKLVIRVGGGYMGIEEFMMYYGQQELQKIQKSEQLAILQEEADKGILGMVPEDRNIDEANDFEGTQSLGRKSVEPGSTVDIEKLKKRLKHESEKKKKLNRSQMGSDDDDVTQQDDKTTIVGIGEVRKALKRNVHIKTYEETKKGAKFGKGALTDAEKMEKQLKTIEQRVGTKLRDARSPTKEKPKSAFLTPSQRPASTRLKK